MTIKELLDKLYQARTPVEKYELRREFVKAITNGVAPVDATEFVDDLLKLLHEHRHYKDIVVRLRDVFEEIL